MKTRANERGASLVEHGLLVGLIAVVGIGAVSQLGLQVKGTFTETSKVLAADLDHVLPPAERGPLANVAKNCYEGTSGNDLVEYDRSGNIHNCLHGYSGNDLLSWRLDTPASIYPGPGNDRTEANGGDQVHHYESGIDRIADLKGHNTLIMPRGIKLEDVTFSADDYGVEHGARDLRINLPQGSVTLEGQFEWISASTIIFDDVDLDGTDLDNFSSIVLQGYPTADADTLYGTYSDDIISPLGGNDTVYAGYGNDRVIYTSGSDTYYPHGDKDVLEMPFPLSSVATYIQGNHADFFITHSGGGSIAVPRGFADTADGPRDQQFDSFVFSDQTLSWDEMRLHALRAMETNGSDRISGSFDADEIWSDGGFVRVTPNPGDDIVHWVSGEIYLSGKGGGFDTLDLSSVERNSITASSPDNKDGLIRLPGGERIFFEKIFQAAEGSGNAPAERIIFANGVELNEREIRDLFGAP